MAGLTTMGYCVAGVFFLRFWTRTRDALFGTFTAAFWLLAGEQVLLAWTDLPREEQSFVYLLRLAAFLLIIAGVLIKNRSARRG